MESQPFSFKPSDLPCLKGDLRLPMRLAEITPRYVGALNSLRPERAECGASESSRFLSR